MTSHGASGSFPFIPGARTRTHTDTHNIIMRTRGRLRYLRSPSPPSPQQHTVPKNNNNETEKSHKFVSWKGVLNKSSMCVCVCVLWREFFIILFIYFCGIMER